MTKRNLSLALTAIFAMALVTMASAGIPHSGNSTASADNCGRVTFAPGGGEDLVDAGAGNDYRIAITVLDINGNACSLAATDMVLFHPNLVACSGNYSQADDATDASGYAEFTGTAYAALAGDGNEGILCDDNDMYIVCLGVTINDGNPVCVAFDSPDLSGDLQVGAADFGRFVTDYGLGAGSADLCHDFNEDGENSAADFAIFAAYYGASVCP